MRLEDKSLSFVVNFFLGIAWAFVLLGSVTSFLSLYQENILFAIIYAFLGAIPGMIIILFLEFIITQKEQQLELKKQTKLLEELLSDK